MNVRPNYWDNAPFDFWNSPASWPLTPERDGLAFLATAINRIGRAVYPEWVGREPWMQAERMGEILANGFERLDVDNITMGRMLLAMPEPVKFDELSSWGEISASRTKPDLRPLSDSEWGLAIEKRDALKQLVTAAEARWDEVLKVSFVLLKTGGLETRLRPTRGGEYVDPPAGLWNTDLAYARPRFAKCQVDLERPFDQSDYEAPAGSTRQFHLIFVTTASLEASVNLIRLQIDGADKAKTSGDEPSASPSSRPRKPRAPSPQARAIGDWVAATGFDHGSRTKSYAEITNEMLAWAYRSEHKGKYKYLALTEKTVSRYFDKNADT